MNEESITHLETLGIPVLNFTYGGHFTQVIRKFIKLFNAVGKADWKLLCIQITR